MRPFNGLPVAGVELKLTNACMLRCSFCVNDDGPHKHGDIDAPAAIRALQELNDAPSNLGNLGFLSFTGGEPLSRIHIIEQIASVMPDTTTMGIATNGILLSDDTIERLQRARINRITVSYDTTRPQDYVLVRKGANVQQHSKLTSMLKHIPMAGITLNLRVALGAANVNVLTDIYACALESGADTLFVKPIVSSGRAAQNIDTVSLPPEKILTAFKNLRTVYDATKTRISVSCFSMAKATGLPVNSCTNNQTLYLDINGSIFSCNYVTDSNHLLGDYRQQGGMTCALRTRRERYAKLFGPRNDILGCPSSPYSVAQPQLKLSPIQ